MKTYFGPAILAFQYSSPAAGERLAAEMADLISEHNGATNGTVLSESESTDLTSNFCQFSVNSCVVGKPDKYRASTG
jgi:hypothetical protein